MCALAHWGSFNGVCTGVKGYSHVAPFFDQSFPRLLVIYLLDIGMLAAQRLDRFIEMSLFLVGFALIMRCVWGV